MLHDFESVGLAPLEHGEHDRFQMASEKISVDAFHATIQPHIVADVKVR